MANRERGEVGFDAKGKSWIIRYTTNAMCEIEDALGASIIQIANNLGSENGVHIKTLRTLFRIGVVGCENDDQAGELMDAVGITDAGVLIGEAFNAAFPHDEDKDAGKPEAATA